jgi:hypothetical protein
MEPTQGRTRRQPPDSSPQKRLKQFGAAIYAYLVEKGIPPNRAAKGVAAVLGQSIMPLVGGNRVLTANTIINWQRTMRRKEEDYLDYTFRLNFLLNASFCDGAGNEVPDPPASIIERSALAMLTTDVAEAF